MIEITKQQRQGLHKAERKYGASFILAFGSSVRGLVHQESDLDLAILLKSTSSFAGKKLRESYFDLVYDLQKIFSDKVDLVILNRADPLLLNKVFENCQFLYGNYLNFQRFKIYAFHRYQDYRPYLKLEAEVVSRHLQSL